jgi:hypothetical protein
MASKWKKRLKKVGKAAALAAAAYGASKLARKKATDAPGNALAKAKKLMTSNAAYSDQSMPEHLSHTAGVTGPKSKWKMPFDPHSERWPNRGGGIAKGGKGVALKSGGRVKSMGAAKRGGGVAKR